MPRNQTLQKEHTILKKNVLPTMATPPNNNHTSHSRLTEVATILTNMTNIIASSISYEESTNADKLSEKHNRPNRTVPRNVVTSKKVDARQSSSDLMLTKNKLKRVQISLDKAKVKSKTLQNENAELLKKVKSSSKITHKNETQTIEIRCLKRTVTDLRKQLTKSCSNVNKLQDNLTKAKADKEKAIETAKEEKRKLIQDAKGKERKIQEEKKTIELELKHVRKEWKETKASLEKTESKCRQLMKRLETQNNQEKHDKQKHLMKLAKFKHEKDLELARFQKDREQARIQRELDVELRKTRTCRSRLEMEEEFQMKKRHDEEQIRQQKIDSFSARMREVITAHTFQTTSGHSAPRKRKREQEIDSTKQEYRRRSRSRSSRSSRSRRSGDPRNSRSYRRRSPRSRSPRSRSPRSRSGSR